MKLPAGLTPLLQETRWLLWRLERGTKVPYQGARPDRHAASNDAGTWCEWAVVRVAWEMQQEMGVAGGIGYALTDGDVVVIDLDKCRDEETGELTAWALEIVDEARLLGAYVEVSVSGTGVHIIGRGVGGVPAKKLVRMLRGGRIELFRAATRYITISGQELGKGGSVDVNVDALVDRLAAMPGVEGAAAGGGGRRQQRQGGGVDTSRLSFAECAKLFGQGLSVDEVVEHLRKHPGKTKTGEFDRRGGGWDLQADVESCWARWSGEHTAQLAVKWSAGSVPKRTLDDTIAAVQALGIVVRYDVFHDRTLITMDGGGGGDHTIDDGDLIRVRSLCGKKFKFDPGKEHVYDALMTMGRDNAFDPVLDYLNGLTWDGAERIDDWVVTYLGTKDTELDRAVGRLLLVAACRRAREPGVKFDQIFVLEGEEGIEKSTALEVLAGEDNFSDQSILGMHDKEQQECLRGRWIYEIADLRGIRYADADAIKAFASRRTDRARPAYGRVTVELKRRGILTATTNDSNYLKGKNNRRWWPILCGEKMRLRVKALGRDRNQLWAEADAAARAGESLVLPKELWGQMKARQESREEYNLFEDDLADVTGDRIELEEGGAIARVTTHWLLAVKLDLRKSEAAGMVKKVSEAMRTLGWKPAQWRPGGNRNPVRGWEREWKEVPARKVIPFRRPRGGMDEN
jgi:hypothetical protein